MSSLPDRFGLVFFITGTVFVPVAAGVYLLLARRRMVRGWGRSWAWRSAAADVGLVVGTAPWVWMIMTPTGRSGAVRLTPFQDLGDVLAGGDALVQLIGNLLVFFTLGFCLPIRHRLASLNRVVIVVGLVAVLLSTALEVLQWALDLGRVTSVDDVLVNTAGAVLGALLSMRWWRSRTDTGRPAASM